MTTTRRALFGRPYTLMTLGSTGLVFLAAFEALAVTAVMPVITDALDGRALYSAAFVATMASGLVGMVAAGAWADRQGPNHPLLASIAVFAVGLAGAGLAETMNVFVAARVLQGLGAGGITVALNVLVARVYPEAMHPRIFGLYAAAWVVPSMVGPSVAGLVAYAFSWHWVFLGVLVLVAGATALIVPVVRRPQAAAGTRTVGSGDPRRIGAAVVAAGAVVALSLGGELAGGYVWPVAAAAVLVIAVAVHGLLPPGTYRARRGLPATVLVCAAAGATFFSTEVYLPLLLHDRYGLPPWLSGVTLTTGAVAWALGSDLQGRYGDRISHRTVIRAGTLLLGAGAGVELVTAALTLHPVIATAGWFLAGAGMGLIYPRASTVVLAESPPGQQGVNSAAKSIADSVGGSVALTVSGLLFAALASAGDWASFAGTLTLSTALGLGAVLVSGRV